MACCHATDSQAGVLAWASVTGLGVKPAKNERVSNMTLRCWLITKQAACSPENFGLKPKPNAVKKAVDLARSEMGKLRYRDCVDIVVFRCRKSELDEVKNKSNVSPHVCTNVARNFRRIGDGNLVLPHADCLLRHSGSLLEWHIVL